MKILKENYNYFRNNVINDENKWNNLFLVNWFVSILKNIENLLNYKMIYFFPCSHRLDIVTNFLFFLIKKNKWDLRKYKIIQINTWENFLNAKKYKNQVLIWESHWFHFWLNFQDTLKHFAGIKKVIASIVEFLLWRLIRYNIKKFDIYYVSTPNMLEFAKKIRLDAKWLPNAINIQLFNPIWKSTDLKWDPVIFYPTRLHSFKNPKFWIDLFKKIKSKYPEATLHLIKYPNWWDPLASYYEKKLTDSETYIWHNFKTAQELSEMYRWSDIVLWHFHETLWMMSLVELEATACWTAIISYDKYEIKTDLKNLESITFSILSDKNKYNDFVSKNMEIVLKNHSPENIAKQLKNDISIIKNDIKIVCFSKKITKKQLDDLEIIEKENFLDVWMRWEKEFLYKFKNKFSCSYLLLKEDKVIWFIIGYSDWKYWYINRFAISKDYQWIWLWNKLINYFSDNLKYNSGVEVLELVTHSNLWVDWYYLKNWYTEVKDEEYIKDFLNRKNKIESLNEYILDNKEMLIFYKNI